jgi:beta propeller repeat protein
MLVTRTTYGGVLGCFYVSPTKRGAILLWAVLSIACSSAAIDFTVSQISDDKRVNREPVISETGLAAWTAYADKESGVIDSDIFVFKDGKAQNLTLGKTGINAANMRPQVQSNFVVWVATLPATTKNVDWVLREVPNDQRDTPSPELRALYTPREDDAGRKWYEEVPTNAVRQNIISAETGSTNPLVAAPAVTGESPAVVTASNMPSLLVEPRSDVSSVTQEVRRTDSGDTEICLWQGGAEIERITRDYREDLGPSLWGNMIAWQKSKGWPFGWEIMLWADGQRIQLTTNYYYDMAPKVHQNQAVWYGWDGHDFEIYLYDHTKGTTIQITSNQYDDVSPAIWGGTIVWEGYAGVDADIFMWKTGTITKISDNIEDDLNPRIWNGKVVWQGFDGDDFEIYYYDGEKTMKLTSNTYDDLNPDIGDGLVCWMGYFDNWDSEIFVWDGTDTTRLTDNEWEDRDPKTASRRVIWQSDQEKTSIIYLAEPK